MDIEKIAADFEKRFSKKCRRICFVGMPLTVLDGKNSVLSASLSVGGCAAVSGRDDGRITVEFDGNNKYISANILDLDCHKEEPLLTFLARLRDIGANFGGADILLEYNTDIYGEYEALLLYAMYSLYGKVPGITDIKTVLSNPKRDFVSLAGIKNTLLLQGQKNVYLKYCDSALKIIICSLESKNHIEKCSDIIVETASKMLAAGYYEKFGEMVIEEYGRQIKNGGISRTSKYLFELSTKLNDAFGCGILENGGIFAFVENKKVNAFVQNLKKEYETYYGAAPGFYITRAEQSGFGKKDL